MVDDTPIAMPRNYPSFWSEEIQNWITQESFMLWYGDVTSVRPAYEGVTFLFQNSNLMENSKELHDRLYNSELIRVYVDFDTSRDGWMEIVDLEAICSYFEGCQNYEDGEWLGIINYASDLKSSLVDKYYELKWGDDDDYYNQGDDDYYNDEEEAYRGWRDGGRDDYAFGAEKEGKA